MGEFTLQDLVVTLRQCAGEEEDVDLDGDILDVTFDELGYDSLALLNTIGRISRERGIELPDDLTAEAGTPRELLDTVNHSIRQLA
jgi:act minimal PKS acyl carrier protein